MSLITRCPACETMFKVVPDQLRISEGWVRCGQCGEIFDASLHLLPGLPTEPEPRATPDRETVTPGAAAVTWNAPPWPLDIDLDSDPSAPVDVGPLPPLSAAREEQTAAVPAPMPPEPAPAPPVPDQLPDLDFGATREASARPEVADDRAAADEGEPSFLRDRRLSGQGQRPLVRAGWTLLSLLLLLGLLGQIVWHERNRMAALDARFMPWLTALCAPLKCSVSPLQQIESITIDSASFVKIRGDAYRLNLTLKNSSHGALALPAVELTLTDVFDQPVVRRVFMPGEISAPPQTLAASSNWIGALGIVVKAAGVAERVAGYRVLVFYP